MTHISSVSQTKQNALLTPYASEIHSKDYSIRGSSSIASLKAPACLTSIITFPLRLVKYLINRIISVVKFVCCCGKGDKLDWQNTEKIFRDVRTHVWTSTEDSTKRQKAFGILIQQLKEDCPPAMGRFKMHMAFAFAANNRVRERAEQEKWAAANFKKVPFEDLLSNVDNSILKNAVRSFYDEIASKTPQN